MTSNRILMVEPETQLRTRLMQAAEKVAVIDTDCGVPTARHRLLAMPYNWLVTNIRLDAYNGLHLAYLARMTRPPIRLIVYGEGTDLVLAREAQGLGAFYESRDSIATTLAGYLTTSLPPTDRRNAAVRDRRSRYRGGRRKSDVR